MPRRIPIALAVLFLVGAVAAARSWPAEVSGRRVVAGAVVDEVLGIGTLESARAVPVAFEVPGRVTSLAVDEGDLVTEGQLLGTLDVDASQADLAVAEASERVARAAIGRASSELERGRAAAAGAAAERARADALFASGTISASARDGAIEHDRSAAADVGALEGALRQAWVDERLLRLLCGGVSEVAAGMHRSATKRDQARPVRRSARPHRSLCQLPAPPQGPSPVSRVPGRRLPHRHRRHRGRLPLPRQGPEPLVGMCMVHEHRAGAKCTVDLRPGPKGDFFPLGIDRLSGLVQTGNVATP